MTLQPQRLLLQAKLQRHPQLKRHLLLLKNLQKKAKKPSA